MSFDPCNRALKIWKSTETLILNMDFTWECEDSFPHIL
jgi:hypothetical protein